MDLLPESELSPLRHSATPMTRKRGGRWTCPHCSYTRAYRGRKEPGPNCHGLMTVQSLGSFSMDLESLYLKPNLFTRALTH